eukprot:TRINITY_DN6123_c0_g1_i2.p1 TRINITY_DN6123_c0_g1~~TRINITY_DN6123_c0_g1_i2.p1  ORF type:complete len:172 (+),score=34.88 TRINITY_DN6123_c0_g1_i2:122-637(+)
MTLSIRMSVSNKDHDDSEHRSISKLISKIYAEDGIVGFYKGLSSGLFGVALVGGIYYYFYQTFRNIANDVLHGKIGDGANILIASSAGALTALLNNPVWIVNTRLMLEQKKSESKRTSTLDAAKKIFQEEGIAGFWAGIIPALILVSNPTIQYVVFERLKVHCDSHHLTWN